jgi:1,4-dihydroxy-2-naphthoate octaprenyltransferase
LEFEIAIFAWLAAACWAATIGYQRGKSVIGWFFLGIFFGFLAVAFALALLVDDAALDYRL